MQFEQLPVEIILNEIYPYFSLEELYKIFYQLNQRLRNIIQLTTHLKFEVNNATIDHRALSHLKSSIACLTVNLGQFDIRNFTNIRVLILNYPSLQQRNVIRPNIFPYLNSLKLAYPIEDQDLLNIIFSGQFPCLQKCEFDRTRTDHKWIGAPKLRSVSASVHGQYGIISLLRACPNVSRLTAIVYDQLQPNLLLPSHSIECKNDFNQLRYLFVRSNLDIFMGILQLMSSSGLKSLIFETIQYNPDQAYTLDEMKSLCKILRNFLQLSYLHFKMNSINFDETLLYSLHSLFRYVHFREYLSPRVISSHPIYLNE